MNVSADEDADLRDLVAYTLESNGVLGKIKAELRAKVFMVLDAHDKKEMNQLPVLNEKLQNFMNTKEGRLVTGLVREFLEFFDLEYSLAVFDPESNFGDRYKGREGLAEELNVNNTVNSTKPIISALLENYPQGMPKLDLGSINEDILKKGRVSPEISPRSVSSGSRNNSPRMSRIPQRRKDKKKTEKSEKTEITTPKDSDKSLDEELASGGQKSGNVDLSVSLNDDDILAEITKPRFTSFKDKPNSEAKKGFSLDEDTSRPSFEDSWLHNGNNLTSLKGPSLLSGPKDLGVSSGSADFKELEEIDRKINALGFGLPAEDKASSHGDDYNDSYADDFHPSTHSNEDNSSIPEEIDGDPLSVSLGSFSKSEHSKADDLVTSDRTISPVDYKDLDYREDVDSF